MANQLEGILFMSSIGTPSRERRSVHRNIIFVVVLLAVALYASPWEILVGLDNNPRPAYAERENFSHSDLNKDGVVDLADLIKFSDKFLGLDWQTVDWCQWIQDANNIEKYGDKYRELFIFIHNDYQCDQPPPPPPEDNLTVPPPEDNLTVKHTNDYPLRVALGPNGKLYVSNAQIGSVFIYEVGPSSLNLIGELKGLVEPLGVALFGQDLCG
jgi:hypothetical protein